MIVGNERGNKVNLLATIGPKQDDGILLSGHTDVVPVATQTWISDPFKLWRGGTRLHGRGTTDMKGFLASASWRLPTGSMPRH
jgi:acetylornithine deacetylase